MLYIRCVRHAQAAANAPGARLLVTSRKGLGISADLFREQQVCAIGETDAVSVVRATAKHLTQPQAAQVAAACLRVPLYLRLVSEALVTGRMELEVGVV